MRPWSVPPLLALIFACFASTTLRAADDLGTLYVQAYMAYRAGERLESEGKSAEATQKFRFCASVLEQIQKNSPDYKPDVVEFRLGKTRAALARLQNQPAPSLPAFPASPSATPAPAFARPSGGYRLTVPGQPAPSFSTPPRSDAAIPGQSTNVGAIKALQDRIREMQALLSRERQANEHLRQQLLESTAREQSALTERDRTKVQSLQLQGQIDEAQRMIADLQSANAVLTSQRDADAKRIEDLQADLEVANEYNDDLLAKLDQAATFITASEKIRGQLLAERADLSKRASGKSAGEIARLTRERNDAQAARDKLSGQLADLRKQAEEARQRAETLAADREKESQEAARQRQAELDRLNAEKTRVESEAKELETRNLELTEKLTAAEGALRTAQGESRRRDALVGELRGQVEGLEGSLNDLNSQIAEGAKRIDELEKQLADTSTATAAATGALAEENALLKSLVNRQLAEQARRQQARKLVAEELEKLKLRSGSLAERLDALAASEVELAPRERALVAPASPVRPGGDFVIEKKSATSDLPESLAARAREANQLSQRGQYAEALALYRAIVDEAPDSHFAQLNLGVLARQMGDYAVAIDAFQRALALKPDDALTLTNLGMAQFRADQGTQAVATLEKAVKGDSENHLSHYFFALALNHTGDRERARAEVERSLELKPDYVPAQELSRELREKTGENTTPVAP